MSTEDILETFHFHVLKRFLSVSVKLSAMFLRRLKHVSGLLGSLLVQRQLLLSHNCSCGHMRYARWCIWYMCMKTTLYGCSCRGECFNVSYVLCVIKHLFFLQWTPTPSSAHLSSRVNSPSPIETTPTLTASAASHGWRHAPVDVISTSSTAPAPYCPARATKVSCCCSSALR